MEPRNRRLTIIGVSVLVLAVAGIGIAQANGRPAVAAAATDASTTAGTAGSVVAGSLTSAATTGATTVDDATLEDSAIAAFGMAVLAGADEPGLDSGPAVKAERLRVRLGRLARPHGKRLERFVHAETTLDLPQKGITTFGADHGMIASIGDGTIAVKRADGQTVTLTTDADTKVRTKGDAAKLGDLKVGTEVLVVSRRTGESWAAKRIVVIPPTPTGTAPGA